MKSEPFWSSRLLIGAGLAGILMTDGSASGQPYIWKNVAINGGGFVTGLITHPNAPGVVYARTDIGGAYRWNGAGNSWVALLDFGFDANTYGVESVAIDPADGNRLYIATSRGSSTLKYILVSTNRGETFASYTPPFSLDGNARGRGGGERMTVDPNLGSILFYGTKSQGLYKSVNHGASWSQVTSFPVTTTANTVGIVFVQFVADSGTPGSPTPTIYAGVSRTNNNIYRSLDGGTNWSLVANVGPSNFMPHHAVPDGLGNLYFTFNDTCGPNDNVATGAVCKLNLSTLTSADVSPVKQAGEQGGWGGVSVDRQHPTTVVVSTLDRWWPPPYDQIYRSTNGGGSWATTAAGVPGTGSAPWAAARNPHWCESVQIDPFDSDRAWYVTGYGIFSCTNLTAADSGGTVNWIFTSDGLEETVPLGLASPPGGPHLLSQHGDQGGFRHFNLDVSPPLADYFSTHRVTSLGIDFAENNPDVIARLFSNAPHGAYSADGGTTWQDFGTPPPGVSGDNRGNIAVSANGSRLVWMPANSSAYFSTDNGTTWTISTNGPTGTRIPISDRVNSSKFYIYSSASSGRLYISTNGGATYYQGAAISSGTRPIAVAGHEGHLWLPRGSSGLSRSTDSGASFTTLSSVQQAAMVAAGKAAPGQSYPAIFIYGQVTNVTGLFRSDNQGASWVRINDDQHQFGLGNGWLHCLCGDPRIYGRVYCGTEGRGVIYGSFAPPEISCTFTNGQIELTWPLAYSDWSLQAQTNAASTGLSANWVAVSGAGGTNRVLLPANPANDSVFYRLVSP